MNTLYNLIRRVSGALIAEIHIALIINKLYAADPTTEIIIKDCLQSYPRQFSSSHREEIILLDRIFERLYWNIMTLSAVNLSERIQIFF